MPIYSTPEIYILNILPEGTLAGSLERPVEGEVIPW